ncbi:hypothetical protein EZS27_011347 [termite gut metagenome]|uniref:DUF3408 domain-containing protein n=1 Tax=termite gut metagenome TaxID=433724 RepID=A0A5J4S4X0_9ZZZZ
MTKRINPDEIDENFILASVKKDKTAGVENVPDSQEKQPPPQEEASLPLEPQKEESRRKRGKGQDYETLFIKESNITARLGKTVYIRKEFHERIQKIVQVIGDNEVSLFSYIDNILSHHFESYQEDINQSYKQKNKDNIL